MKFPLFTIVAIMLLFSSCKKKEPDTPYSYWYVNSDSFSSNNIDGSEVRQGSSLLCYQLKNRFAINFNNLAHFPTSGSYRIYNAPFHENPVNVDFYYNDVFYIPSAYNNTYLSASIVGGQIHLKIPPTWFLNYYDVLDSVSMTGDFIVP